MKRKNRAFKKILIEFDQEKLFYNKKKEEIKGLE
jgi:hypothetical protein